MENAKRIDGRKLAQTILEQLTIQIKELKTKGIHPTLHVFMIGDDSASKSYITQKQNAAKSIGANLVLTALPKETSDHEMATLIAKSNTDKTITGIIIQRPLPAESTIKVKTLQSVIPEKDIDGFVPKSQFEAPVARAVLTILERIFMQTDNTQKITFFDWLRQKQVVVIGKGETGGHPIIHLFEKLTVPVVTVDTKTEEPDTRIKTGSIVISCVGKPGILHKNNVKEGAIVVSVGITRFDGKLIGDYNEEEIAPYVSFYTPTPGGVGPVNVACLMKNLVDACRIE